MKTIKEFKNEVKSIRQDIRKRGNDADRKLMASWLDRLLISLEELSPTLDLMQEELDQLSKIGTKMKKGKLKVKIKKEKTEVKEKKGKKKEKGFWPF